MNKYLLLTLFCWFALPSMAQITYTSVSFPQSGDILSITTAAPDTLLTVTPPDTLATAWDFTTLIALNKADDTIRAASTGADFALFPSSDILQPLIGQFGGIAYTDVTTTQIERIGGGLEFFGISFVAPYANKHITQIVPLTYGDLANDTYVLRFGTHIDSVPFLRQLLDSMVTLPGGISPDSIRFAIEGDEMRKVDAWGTCQMRDTTYDVIRQKVVTEYEIKIEVRVVVPFLGPYWFNATSFLQLPIPTKTTVVRYDFLSEGVKQPIVTLNLDSAETIITSITFLDTIIVDSSNIDSTININYLQDQLEVSIYPNPAQQQIVIEMASSDLPVAGYNLAVVDMLGRIVLAENAIKNETHQINVANIPNGQYIMVLRDKSGGLLKREQIEILR